MALQLDNSAIKPFRYFPQCYSFPSDNNNSGQHEGADTTRLFLVFGRDFLLELIVTANFAAAATLKMSILSRLQSSIKYLSSFTFSAYVFHMPLVILIWNGAGVHGAITFYALLALAIFAFGQLTERQTKFYRSVLQRWMPLRGNQPAPQVPQPTIDVSLSLSGLDRSGNTDIT